MRKADIAENCIKSYEEEIARIEEQSRPLIEEYMEYEKGIITSLTQEGLLATGERYPELQSNTLVKELLDREYEISEKIIQSQEIKNSKSVYKWWIYFGK